MITIQVQDKAVQDALQALAKRVGNMKPKLQTIGDDIMARAKARFGTSTGPDGQRWKPNALSTIQALLHNSSGVYAKFSNLASKKESWARVGNKKGWFLKDGVTLSKKAQTSLAGKKVLVDTGSLASQFHVSASGTSVTVGNSMKYAAIHQFGGKAGRGNKVTIPARPFLPIKSDGSLYPQEQVKILDALNAYLSGGM
jgi:phage gpG-like protein